MQDNQLIQLFLPIINDQLIAQGYENVQVAQSYQPTQQGVNTPATVYFFKVADHRYGFLRREDVYNNVTGIFDHLESQQYNTTFQISALVTQNPTVVNTYTASDLVNEVSAIMQSDYARYQLRKANVGIFRVEDIINPYFIDDRDRYEASPSFDFILSHKQVRVSTTPVVESVGLNIKRV